MGLMWRHISVLGVNTCTGIQDNNAHNHKWATNGLRQYWIIWYILHELVLNKPIKIFPFNITVEAHIYTDLYYDLYCQRK